MIYALSVGAMTLTATAIAGRPSLAVMGALGALGFVDDLGSLQGRSQTALNKRAKFIAFVAIGVAAAFGLYEGLELSAANVPYAGRFDLAAWYIPIAVGVLVLTGGGMGITDGLDGLAAGTSAIAFGAFGIIALIPGQAVLATVGFC